jgi:hypothetical protein
MPCLVAKFLPNGLHGRNLEPSCGSQDSEDNPEYEASEHLRANFN